MQANNCSICGRPWPEHDSGSCPENDQAGAFFPYPYQNPQTGQPQFDLRMEPNPDPVNPTVLVRLPAGANPAQFCDMAMRQGAWRDFAKGYLLTLGGATDSYGQQEDGYRTPYGHPADKNDEEVSDEEFTEQARIAIRIGLEIVHQSGNITIESAIGTVLRELQIAGVLPDPYRPD